MHVILLTQIPRPVWIHARPDLRANTCLPRFFCPCEFMLVQRLLSVWIRACLRLCLADSSCFPNLGWNELKDSSLLWISAHLGYSACMNSCSSRFCCLCGFMLAQVGGHPNSVRPDSELVWILLNSTYLSMWICACLTWGAKTTSGHPKFSCRREFLLARI